MTTMNEAITRLLDACLTPALADRLRKAMTETEGRMADEKRPAPVLHHYVAELIELGLDRVEGLLDSRALTSLTVQEFGDVMGLQDLEGHRKARRSQAVETQRVADALHEYATGVQAALAHAPLRVDTFAELDELHRSIQTVLGRGGQSAYIVVAYAQTPATAVPQTTTSKRGQA